MRVSTSAGVMLSPKCAYSRAHHPPPRASNGAGSSSHETLSLPRGRCSSVFSSSAVESGWTLRNVDMQPPSVLVTCPGPVLAWGLPVPEKEGFPRALERSYEAEYVPEHARIRAAGQRESRRQLGFQKGHPARRVKLRTRQ